MRILVVSANRLGDAVITAGVLDHLARQYPDARWTIACGPAAAGVYARMPGLERIVLFDKRADDRHWPKLWRAVVGTRWDRVIDFRGSALPWLLWAKHRVSRRRRPGRMFEQHAAMLGIDPAPLPVAWTAPEDRARAAALLPPGRPAIGFGVTANWAGKVWPPDRFAALFARLAAELPGAVPVLFAGPGEKERALAAPALAALPGAIDAVGTLSIPEVAATISRCALFVGNDSGLMHLAAATGTPTVGLLGATLDRADEMAPAGRRATWSAAPAPTMEALTVDQVLQTCRTLLQLTP